MSALVLYILGVYMYYKLGSNILKSESPDEVSKTLKFFVSLFWVPIAMWYFYKDIKDYVYRR